MSTRTMKAIVIYEAGGSDKLIYTEVPMPKLKEGWSLVRVMGRGINHSEIFTRNGLSPSVRFPRILGIECVGVIEETTDPDRLPIGQKVVSIMGEMGRDYEGSIIVEGKDISGADPVELRRSMGYVIQQVGLFPHMTVLENITAIPQLMKWDKAEMRERADELLDLVGLDPDEFRDRYPRQLSGGQQQRIGLARALVLDPDIMLLDEPFGAIDAITRLNLQNELMRIHGGLGKTFLFVTHDINEAFKLGNRVMVMNEGRLLQFGTPEEIATNPADEFVRSLIDSARSQGEFWAEA